jgi:hypothetical protein
MAEVSRAGCGQGRAGQGRHQVAAINPCAIISPASRTCDAAATVPLATWQTEHCAMSQLLAYMPWLAAAQLARHPMLHRRCQELSCHLSVYLLPAGAAGRQEAAAGSAAAEGGGSGTGNTPWGGPGSSLLLLEGMQPYRSLRAGELTYVGGCRRPGRLPQLLLCCTN